MRLIIIRNIKHIKLFNKIQSMMEAVVKMTNILITGFPRSGKTTLIKKVLEKLQKQEKYLAGFYTEELKNNCNQRVGFQIRTIAGQQKGILAQSMERTAWRIGKYFVNLKEFEVIVLPELQRTAELIVIDEIGKMELLSQSFREQVLRNLENGNVLATITKKGGGVFVQELKARKDVILFEISPENRDAILDKVISIMQDEIKT